MWDKPRVQKQLEELGHDTSKVMGLSFIVTGVCEGLGLLGFQSFWGCCKSLNLL